MEVRVLTYFQCMYTLRTAVAGKVEGHLIREYREHAVSMGLSSKSKGAVGSFAI